MRSEKIIVSVVIKALNEEKNIDRTVQSALQAIVGIGGEVILADSHSVDRTVEFASRYPIKIVRLNRPEERCCGIGAQLGYQFSQGRYLYVVDGDMEIAEGFLETAIQYLEKDKGLAAVGGRIVEKNLESWEFQARVLRTAGKLQSGIVDRLDGGGVYRRAAIESVGYLTNRNLHSYEEFELAARLRSHGWKLKRLPVPAAYHFGHKTEAFALLMRRWRGGYVLGLGELLRSSMWQPHFKLVVQEIKEYRLYSVVVLWWLLLLSLVASELSGSGRAAVPLMFAALPLIIMILKKRSMVKGIYAVTSWNFYAMGMLRGFFRRQCRPAEKIDAERVNSCSDVRAELGVE
ncbi:MAG: hypothetical protein V7606_4356 [Burkholderiales bacterium]